MVTKKLPLLRLMVMGAIVSLLAGCATMRYGGAPEPSFNINDDIKELSLHFEGSTSITNFYANPSEQARNEFIVGRITLVNLRYLKFIRSLTSERQLLDAATAISIMGLGLAGSMVPLAQTTKILAAVSAGVAGTKEVIDKNYYFEKTIPALVAQMNANRQIALAPLLAGSQKSLKDYPFATAVVDLNNYYSAGTFTGAIEAIQATASATEQKQKKENAKLLPATKEQITLAQNITKAIAQASDLAQIQKAIKILEPTATPANDLNRAKDQLLDMWINYPPTEIQVVVNAFNQAGIAIPTQ